MPGRRFAFGSIFVGIIPALAGDTAMALKELEVRYATKRAKDYKLTDGEGFYLLVRPNGSKLWRMKYRYAGKERLLSFGAYPAVSLAEAPLRRAKAHVVLGEGGDPGAGNKPRLQMTFEEAVRKWHGHHLDALGVITPSDVLAMVRRVEARSARCQPAAPSSMSVRSIALRFREAGPSVIPPSISNSSSSPSPARGICRVLDRANCQSSFGRLMAMMAMRRRGVVR